METKKILAGVLIVILIMILFKNLHTTTTITTTKVVSTNPYYRHVATNNPPNPNYHPNANPYKAQYYN